MIPLKDNIPNARFPLITVALVAINVIAYLLSIRHGGSIINGPSESTVLHDSAIPYDFTHPGQYCTVVKHVVEQPVSETLAERGVVSTVECKHGAYPGQINTWLTAFTAMFLHGSILHIGGNMIFLAIFGPNVEEAMGRARYVVFYLLGGLVALAAQVAVGPNSTAPTLGASGAIAAVLGGYIVLYPRARILSLVFLIFFFTIIEVPAIFLLGFWFLEQVYFGSAGLTNPAGGGGGVAYFAHVGGFAFGLALIRLFAVHRKSPPPRYPVY
ncbi:MAG TPA: rhomboid family intramembrane serine protease [Solirubrobacteraceae bacterium]|jgi:membrane associated rhomboid family serine protease|nr:rhomboid family intramembrane serine protease [Solirubrobacteraceae bacterium]